MVSYSRSGVSDINIQQLYAIVSRLCHELQVRRDGTVVAWGDPVRGGDVTPVVSKLKQGASDGKNLFPIPGDVKNMCTPNGPATVAQYHKSTTCDFE